MKNLRLFNFHANYLNNKFIMTRNELYPIASTCLDDNDLHIDNMFEYVNYIENPGGAWINTGIDYNNGHNYFEIKYKFNDLAHSEEAIIGHGAMAKYYTHTLLKYAYNNSSSSLANILYYYCCYTSEVNGTNRPAWYVDVQNHQIDLNPHTYKYVISTAGMASFYFDGVETKTFNASSWYQSTQTKQTYLFTYDNTGTDNFYGRIYYLKIWNTADNKVLHHLVPIRLMPGNSALQRYGFIDKITNKMYFSSTSVEFTGG